MSTNRTRARSGRGRRRRTDTPDPSELATVDGVNERVHDADEVEVRTAAVLERYIGPMPSPARGWSPWVIATSALTGALAATQCGLNLVERHYQQQRKSPHPPSATQIRNTIHLIHTVGTLTFASAVGFAIVGIVWSAKRRPRARLQRDGEGAVEPSLRRAAPVAYFAFWSALAVAVLFSLVAKAAVHSGMSIDDFVRYRTLLALSAASRTVMWLCWIPLVVEARNVQARREAMAGPSPVLQAVDAPGPA
jgi:hypothetical protein